MAKFGWEQQRRGVGSRRETSQQQSFAVQWHGNSCAEPGDAVAEQSMELLKQGEAKRWQG